MGIIMAKKNKKKLFSHKVKGIFETVMEKWNRPPSRKVILFGGELSQKEILVPVGVNRIEVPLVSCLEMYKGIECVSKYRTDWLPYSKVEYKDRSGKEILFSGMEAFEYEGKPRSEVYLRQADFRV